MILQCQHHDKVAQAENAVDDHHDVKLAAALLDGRSRGCQVVRVVLDLLGGVAARLNGGLCELELAGEEQSLRPRSWRCFAQIMCPTHRNTYTRPK